MRGKGDFDSGFHQDAWSAIPEHSGPPPLLMLAVRPSVPCSGALCAQPKPLPTDAHLPLTESALSHVWSRAPSGPALNLIFRNSYDRLLESLPAPARGRDRCRGSAAWLWSGVGIESHGCVQTLQPQPAPTPLLRLHRAPPWSLCAAFEKVSWALSRSHLGSRLHFCLNLEVGSRIRISPLAMGVPAIPLPAGFSWGFRDSASATLLLHLTSDTRLVLGLQKGGDAGFQGNRTTGPLPCGGAAPPIPGPRPPRFLCYAIYLQTVHPSRPRWDSAPT